MKKMKIALINRNTWATLVLFAGIFIQSSALGQLTPASYSTSSFSEFKANIQQPELVTAISSKSFQCSLVNTDVSEINQNAALIQNGIKLDSIEEYNFTGWKSYRFKYYFDYENGILKTKRSVHFGKSYSDSLGITELWTFNHLQQLEKYERLKKLTNWNDTIITDEENSYVYLGDTVIVKTVSSLRHFFYTNGTYNNVKYEAGDVLYNNYQERNTYNEQGQLTEYEGGTWNEQLFFEYDDLGNLIYRYRFPYYVENYNYRYAERSIDIIIRFYPFTDVVIPFDSITDWIEDRFWHFDLDQFGRDSICTYYSGFSGMSTSLFDYDPNGNLMDISISFRDEVDTTKWLEKSRLQYSYNNSNQLESFLQTYYDEHWNQWDTQNSKKYFYSEVKSVALEPAPENVSGSLKIYPNPAGTFINIEGASNTQAQFHIFDLFGRQMLGGNLLNNTIDVSGLARGNYILKLMYGNTTQMQRLIKE